MAVMDDLGIRKDPVRRAVGWAAEKAGRLKPNGQLRGYSPLSLLVELEGLALGVTGKLALWKALRLLVDEEPRLREHPLERLVERAESQQRQIEERRLAAARQAFACLPRPWAGSRSSRAAPARGARPPDGRRGARRAPARFGTADRPRTDRPPARHRELPRDRRAGRTRELRRRGRARALPAHQLGGGSGPDRRPARGRPGRRLHGARRRCRRRHLGEGGVRRAPGARSAHPAGAARGRHRRRGLGQDLEDGVLLRAAAPASTCGRDLSIVPVVARRSARWLGWARAWRARTSR